MTARGSRSVRWTPDQVRAHYARIGRAIPAEVEVALAARPRRRSRTATTTAGHMLRYYDIEPEELVITLPFVPASRNVTEGLNHFARARSKKAFVAMVRRFLELQGARAFRSKVEISVELHFRTNRARDEDNYAPKFLSDSLKGWVFADDSAKFVTWRAPVFVVDGTERTILRVRPITHHQSEELKTG